ncbi:hypothetical protein T484DRAFT_1937965, partial [Baffinella frigidus]
EDASPLRAWRTSLPLAAARFLSSFSAMMGGDAALASSGAQRGGGGGGGCPRGAASGEAAVDMARVLRAANAKHAGRMAEQELEAGRVTDALCSQVEALTRRVRDVEQHLAIKVGELEEQDAALAAEEQDHSSTRARLAVAALSEEGATLKEEATKRELRIVHLEGAERERTRRVLELEKKLSLLASSHQLQAQEIARQAEALAASQQLHAVIQQLYQQPAAAHVPPLRV